MKLTLENTRPRWRRVWQVTVTGTVLITGVVFLLPPQFDAVSSFTAVHDQQNTLEAGLASIGASVGASTGAVESPEMMYQELLRSRRVIERVLATPLHDPLTGRTGTYFGELHVRGKTPAQRLFLAIEKFRKHLSVSVDHKSGLTTVTLSGRHPGMLAAAVNEMVVELQRQSLELRVDVARENERFMGQQEVAAHDSLTRAEAELAAYRQSNLRIGNSPHLLLEGERLERNVRIREEVYLTLVRQEALARLDVNRSVPVISIVDFAEPPPFKARPHRLRLALAGAVAMFLAAFGLFRQPKVREVVEPEAARLRAVPEAPSRLGRIS